MNEDTIAYDGLIKRLSGFSKTAPGTPWLAFWRAFNKTMIYFGLQPEVAEIESL